MTLELAMEYLKVALLLAAYPMGMCLMFCAFEFLSEHSRGFRCFLRWIGLRMSAELTADLERRLCLGFGME